MRRFRYQGLDLSPGLSYTLPSLYARRLAT